MCGLHHCLSIETNKRTNKQTNTIDKMNPTKTTIATRQRIKRVNYHLLVSLRRHIEGFGVLAASGSDTNRFLDVIANQCDSRLLLGLHNRETNHPIVAGILGE